MNSTNKTTFLILFVNCCFFCACSIFVGKNGSDSSTCGLNIDLPCGTLSFASTLTNTSKYENEIYIIDGQNENEIINQINNNNNNNNNTYYHPCLPISLFNISRLTIKFD
eukprot:203822_1